eukprot:SM000124S25939  [mRNA]  locus=s124:249496:259561:+ [translate_table: standard]
MVQASDPGSSMPQIVLVTILAAFIVLAFISWLLKKPASKSSQLQSEVREEISKTSKPAPRSKVKRDKASHEDHHPLLLNTLKFHAEAVSGLAFSADGEGLATACADRVVRIFKLEDIAAKNFKLLRLNLPLGLTPTLVAFGHTSEELIVVAHDAGGAGLFMYVLPDKEVAEKAKGQGKLLPPAVKWEKRRAHDGKSILTLDSAPATYGTGNSAVIVASCSEATDIKLWALSDGKFVGAVDTNQLKNTMATLSPDGRFLAAAAFTADVKIWELVYTKHGQIREVAKVMQLKGHKSAITWLSFTSDAQRIVTTSKDGTIKTWNINVRYHLDEDPKVLKSFPIPLPPAKNGSPHLDRIAVSPDGLYLAATLSTNLYWISIDTGQLLDKCEIAHDGLITCLAWSQKPLMAAAAAERSPPAAASQPSRALRWDDPPAAPTEREYDAIVIGAGIGGIVAATQLAVRGATVLLLEKYVIPGGSSGWFQDEGYTFDVGSSVMFGFGDKGNVNLVTRALAAVGKKLELLPDPAAVEYHVPGGLAVRVHKDYEKFLQELIEYFPHEAAGIRGFYGEAWKVFNALNALELQSLEEPLYLLGQFFRNPVACLTLAYYLPQNAGDIARKYIKDPNLLSFIDAECFIVSTVDARRTPMINAGMVICDRHFSGINYPVGGVGRIAQELVQGLLEHGGMVQYKANVTNVVMENEKATGVQLSDGRSFRAKSIISNATRWDTFEKLVKREAMPVEELNFQRLYKKSPSFMSIHMGVRAEAIPPGTDCHHFILEDTWEKLEEPYATIFLSIPTVLDSSLAPPDRHILHIFTIAWIDEWQGMPPEVYRAKKEAVADDIVARLDTALFPGLKQAVTYRKVGTPKTHRRFLARDEGTYGPIPKGKPKGLLGMPFNSTVLKDTCHYLTRGYEGY